MHEGWKQAANDEGRRFVLVLQKGEDGRVGLVPRLPPDPEPEEPEVRAETEVQRQPEPVHHLQVQAPLPLPAPRPVPASGRLIEFRAVSLRFGAVAALDEVNLAVDAGELIAIVGPSGAGKTSTLRLLQGQVRPTSGRLWIDGVPIHSAWPFRIRRLRRRIGVVFQDYRLLANRTALENVAFALQVSDLSVPRSEARHRAAEQLSLVGLSNRMKAQPRELSGGQQQRLAIARALVTRPRILLADEPTASLDEIQAKRVLRLFKEIADSGTAVLLATHDRSLAGASGARMVWLNNGRLVNDRRSGGRLWVVP